MVSKESEIDAGLKAIADSTRREILGLLKEGQRSVLEIAEQFPVSRPAISKHLRILKEAGLVLETPSGRQRLYTLETGPLDRLRVWLAGFNGRRGPELPGRTAGRRSSTPSFRRPSARDPAEGRDWRVW